MRMVQLACSLAALALVAAPVVPQAQQVYAYPTRGQSHAKQRADYKACHKWAVSKSGFDPGYAPPAPVRAGGALRGAAGGAAGGALIGAISGHAGRGAAIGAATGGVIGAIRQRRQNRAAAEQRQVSLDSYNHALAACYKGRGYTVS